MDCKKRLKTIMLWVIPILVIGCAYALFIEITGKGLNCIIYETIGIKCPGCGVTRMCMNLLHLDFAGAYKSNQLLFISLPIAFIWFVYKMLKYIKNGDSSLSRIEIVGIFIFVFMSIVFCVWRNIA